MIKDLINKYLERTLIYKKQGTYNYYIKVSRSIIKALDFLNVSKVSDLDRDTQLKLVIYYKNETTKKNSQINADIGFLYQVLKYNEVHHNLSPFQKLPDDTTSFRAIKYDALIMLVNYIRSLDINISNNLSWSLSILLMLETGVRMNELLNIKSTNVDLISNSIILETTKNNKKRVVFFDVLCKDLIKQALNRCTEYLIWNYNKNEPMNRASMFYFFNIIHRDLKIEPKIHAHRLRKTFATCLLKNGCPLTTIQKLLGHSDIKMTMTYLEIDSAMIENDYFKFYPYKDIVK